MITPEFSDEFECEFYPEGYREALPDCSVLAAKLLKKALARTEQEAS